MESRKRAKLLAKSDSVNLAEYHENAKQTAAIPAATHRLFPSLQELAFNRLIKRYGIEEVARIIRADEEAAENA